jgi:SAM-dependent methyltransferase
MCDHAETLASDRVVRPSIYKSRLFGLVAPDLGWVPPLRYLLRRERILRLLSKYDFQSLIEVGCGAGALLSELSRPGTNAIGYETSPDALAKARAIAKATGGGQYFTDSEAAEWVCSRDLVCAFDVLEHVKDDREALRSWTRWARSGGRICLTVPAHRARWGAGDEWAGHWRRYDKGDIEQLVLEQGLQIEYLECYGFPLANFSEWWGERLYRRLLAGRTADTSREQASGQSGVDRGYYLGVFDRIDTVLGRFAIRIAFLLQAVTARTNWGSGYLLLARKPAA